MLKAIAYEFLVALIEFIKLFPLMYIVLQFRLKPVRQILIYFSAALILIAVFCPLSVNEFVPLSSYTCVAFTILILSGKGKTMYTIVTYTGISILDMLSVSVMLLFGYDINILEEKGLDHIISNSISIFFVIIISVFSVINRKRNIYRENGRIGIFYLILILLGEISIGGFITGFLYIEGMANIFQILLCISGIIFLILSVVMIVNYTSKNHYKNISEINESLLKSQENYYTMLLQKDRDTIKFRHDISNHINCMYLLFENGQYDELREYFDKIGASLSGLRPSVSTGNDMINAILNDAAEKYPEVRYQIEGKVPDKISLSNMDICTIFSNLFDNAFNAAGKSDEKLVTVSFRFIGGNFFCEVKNTIDHKINITNNELITEKADKANHGHGTYNARNCAEKNNGEITYSCDEKYFSAELVLPKI